MKKSILVMSLGLIMVMGIGFADSCCAMPAQKGQTKAVVSTAKDNPVFNYSFSKKPKIGTTVLIVTPKSKEAFKGKIEAQYGMPSMAGAHDSGWVELVKNKKGSYVTPVTFVMPGEWQIDIRVTEGKSVNEYKVVTNI
jgi:hypothetical protein